MEWLKWLGDLSPTALLIVAIWIIAAKIVTPMLRSHEKTIETMSATFEKHTEALTDSLDENTTAVKKAIEHNEEIVSNHLGKQSKRDVALILEMRNVAAAIETMNNRRRELDTRD